MAGCKSSNKAFIFIVTPTNVQTASKQIPPAPFHTATSVAKVPVNSAEPNMVVELVGQKRTHNMASVQANDNSQVTYKRVRHILNDQTTQRKPSETIQLATPAKPINLGVDNHVTDQLVRLLEERKLKVNQMKEQLAVKAKSVGNNAVEISDLKQHAVVLEVNSTKQTMQNIVHAKQTDEVDDVVIVKCKSVMKASQNKHTSLHRQKPQHENQMLDRSFGADLAVSGIPYIAGITIRYMGDAGEETDENQALLKRLSQWDKFAEDDVVDDVTADDDDQASDDNRQYYTCPFRKCWQKLTTTAEFIMHIKSQHVQDLTNKEEGLVQIYSKSTYNCSDSDDCKCVKHMPFVCLLCGDTSPNLTACFAHIIATHKEEVAINKNIRKFVKDFFPPSKRWYATECDVEGCEYIAEHTSALCKHQYNRHNMPLPPWVGFYTCDLCERKHHALHHYKSHVNTVHKNKLNFLCNECGKTFGTISALKAHALVKHSQVRGYQCSECRKAFKSNSLLGQHQLTHLDYRPFRCAFCTYESNTRGNVFVHLDKHHPGKKRQDGLVVDERWENRKKFMYWKRKTRNTPGHRRCPVCDKLFTRCVLVRHLQLHPEFKPFRCRHCDFGRFRKQQTVQHVKSAHGSTNPDKDMVMEEKWAGKLHVDGVPIYHSDSNK